MKIWRGKNDVIITAAFVHVLIGLQTVVISTSITPIVSPSSSSATRGVFSSPTSSDASLSSSSSDMGVVASGTTSGVLSLSISSSASSFSSPPSSRTSSSSLSPSIALSSSLSNSGSMNLGKTSSVVSSPFPSSVSSSVASSSSLSVSVAVSPSSSVSADILSEATSTVPLVSSQSSSQFLGISSYSTPKPTSSATPPPPTNESSSSTTLLQPQTTITDKTPYSTPILPMPTATPQKQPYISISVTFSIPWGRFCYLIPLFKGRLSRRLIEMKGLAFNFVSIKRIKLLNGVKECENTSYYNKDAVLKFYVSNSEKDLGPEDANMNLTVHAYRILHDYWVNKRMILLDKVFENKVEEVKLYSRNPDQVPNEGLTESVHIGRAIGIAMGLVFLILLIAFLVTWRQNVLRTRSKAKERRLIFANSAALTDEAYGNTEPTARSPSDNLPGTEAQTVIVHTPAEPREAQESDPSPSATQQEPVLELIKNYESENTEEESVKGLAPLAKPEPDSVSEGEPIRAPEKQDDPVALDDKSATSQPESKDTLQLESTVEVVDKQEPTESVSRVSDEKTKLEEPTESVSGVSDEKTKPEVPAESISGAPGDTIKPDFDQPEDTKTDQGVINLGFDEITEPEDKREEETKF